MAIYISTNSIPELQGYSKIQQRALIKQATSANAMNPLLWLGYIVMLLGTFTAITVAIKVIPNANTLPLGMLLGALIGGVIGLLSIQIIFAALRPTLARYRRELEQNQAPHDTH